MMVNSSIVLIVLLAIRLNTIAQDDVLLKTIIEGVRHNDGIINSLTFRYALSYDVSDEWRRARTKVASQSGIDGATDVRDFALEATRTTGEARYTGDNFYIYTLRSAVADGAVIDHKVQAYDGTKRTGMDLLRNTVIRYAENSSLAAASSADPRAVFYLWSEGRPLSAVLASPSSACTVVAEEEVDGTRCYVVDVTRDYIDGRTRQGKTVRKRVWIAAAKGFKAIRACSYSVNDPDRIVNEMNASVSEVAPGIWYCTDATFTTYALGARTPNTTTTLRLNNISVNKRFAPDDFTVDISAARHMYDEALGLKFAVSNPNVERPVLVGDIIGGTKTHATTLPSGEVPTHEAERSTAQDNSQLADAPQRAHGLPLYAVVTSVVAALGIGGMLLYRRNAARRSAIPNGR